MRPTTPLFSQPYTNIGTVNELSGRIDLESTLIRAEALFRKFQRLLEAIDKKSNFPAPRLNPAAVAAAVLPQQGKQPEPEPKKVITPELRNLLSREVVVLPRKDVAGQGEGFLAKPNQAHVK